MNEFAKRLCAVTFLLLVFAVPQQGWARRRDRFPPSPLEAIAPDPLLPVMEEDEPRSLTPGERQTLVENLDRLNERAQTALNAGNTEEAFNIWYRELRLRRVLGPESEVEALGRVGAIAWNETQTEVVRVITQRLEEIQQTIDAPEDRTLRQQLGWAYERVRSPGLAIAVYEQLLADAKAQRDDATIEVILNTIGRLHLSWFDYPKAAVTYGELLELARERGDRATQLELSEKLAYIYEQSERWSEAIEIRQRLIELHGDAGEVMQVARLKLAIASDYEAIGKLQVAAQTYEDAYTLAISLQQLHDAAAALQKLAKLYTSQQELAAALQVYRVLLRVNSQSYDVYGMMNTYDAMARINLEQNEYLQALEALERGLQLAEQLKIRRNYFIEQIEKVKQQLLSNSALGSRTNQ